MGQVEVMIMAPNLDLQKHQMSEPIFTTHQSVGLVMEMVCVIIVPELVVMHTIQIMQEIFVGHVMEQGDVQDVMGKEL